MLQWEVATDKNKDIQDYVEMADHIPFSLNPGYKWRI